MFTRSTTGEKRITVQYVLTGSPLGADVPTLARVKIDSTIPHKCLCDRIIYDNSRLQLLYTDGFRMAEKECWYQVYKNPLPF